MSLSNDPFFAGSSAGKKKTPSKPNNNKFSKPTNNRTPGKRNNNFTNSTKNINYNNKTQPTENQKRKRPGHKLQKRIDDGLEIVSEDSAAEESAESEDEVEKESAAEKRLRLAKAFIARVEEEEREKADGDDIDTDAIAHRLRDELWEQKGTLQRYVAAKYPNAVDEEDIQRYKHRGLPVTCLAVSNNMTVAYVGAKDGSITKWSLVDNKRLLQLEGRRKGDEDATLTAHEGHVLALALSTDTKILASGGRDKLVCTWNATNLECLRRFKGHRDAITCLTFQKQTHQLFSGSKDRTIKLWNLDTLSYIESLFGHQEGVTGIDSLNRERAVSCGGRDRSLRLWKVVEESHMVFQGTNTHSTIDCVAFINEKVFISGSESGALAMWDQMRKKPVAIINEAHGKGNWITSVGALKFGDVVASGSWNGEVKVWAVKSNYHKLEVLLTIPLVGVVNELVFDTTGQTLAIAVSQEHRLGRWKRVAAARNGFVTVKLLAAA